MVATRVHVVSREIADVRARLGWRGKLIIQVRNRLEKFPYFGEPEPAGLGPWRDADSKDPNELAQVIRLLPSNSEPSP